MLQSPALARLLGVASLQRDKRCLAQVLAAQFGLDADFPAGALSALGDGLLQDQAARQAGWMCADPVYLQLQRDSFALAESLRLPAEQSIPMLAELNTHFTEQGLQFHAGRSGAWYLRTQQPPELSASLLAQALGRNVAAFAFSGPDAQRWRGLVNEMQMLLHEHALNQAREARGQWPVNSVWLSGPGFLPARLAAPPQRFYASDALSLGLAQCATLSCSPPPATLAEFVATQQISGPKADAMLVLLEDEPTAAALDEAWLQPVWIALRRRQLSALQLHIGVGGEVLSVYLRPSDTWKLWRKPLTLEAYVSA
ncbi:hypothetical protein ED236_07100 [Pseudomethylobacillus aquaticus]|uniref:Phosphoglycerate mutase n=1 Tax=Pseudomethylobacillus aquaticus TaxID=2676064 RepID=A0A3N0V076_9PROT|nr:hypothetical protein [Pseudomethylobacillus aquaticus]ROH86206.1 hypothetical protein ED236_07100 [Pseudomethylobacillus aquaticus]